MQPGFGIVVLPGQAQIEAEFAALERAWNRGGDLRQTYLSLSEFLAKVKCGHTYANFFNQTKEVQNSLFVNKDKVPFSFRWLQGRMVVTQDLTGKSALPPGTEVVSINAVPVKTILAQLLKITRADGSNEAHRIHYL